jgi:hypothetical protein
MSATATQAARPVLVFARHYLEMVVAMLLGMATLWPLWSLATRGVGETSWVHGIEAESVVMATAMSVPMAVWMAYRGHRARLTMEMCAAMYAGYLVLFPLHWAGALSEMGVMMWGHVLMPLLMLAAMVARRREYLGHC